MQRYLFFTLCWMSTKCQQNVKNLNKGQNLPKPFKIHKNSCTDLWFHLYYSNNFNVFSCWKVVIFPNKILEFSSLWLCSLSQAAKRPVIRFDEGSNHGSDCRRWWDYDLLLCFGKQSLPIESASMTSVVKYQYWLP